MLLAALESLEGKLTDIGTVDKAEQIKQRHGRHDHQVNLHPHFGFGSGVQVDEGMSISAEHGMSINMKSSRTWKCSLVRSNMSTLSSVSKSGASIDILNVRVTSSLFGYVVGSHGEVCDHSHTIDYA